MKNYYFVIYLLVFHSCAHPQTEKELYDKMAPEVCSCMQSNPAQKASILLDSCYKLSVANNYDQLKKLGIDSATQDGKNKIFNGIISNRFRLSCTEEYQRLMKEAQEQEAGKLKFTGKFVSQTINKEKKYCVITLQSTQTGEKKLFRNNYAIPVDEQNDEITIEYEIVSNEETGSGELIAKSISSIGVRSVIKTP